MDDRLSRLDRYLDNTERMLIALQANDLDAVNVCLDRNVLIMREYESFASDGPLPDQNKSLRDKIEAVMEANQKCFRLAERKCRDLRKEMDTVEKNSEGVRKYGVQQTRAPRFIDRAM